MAAAFAAASALAASGARAGGPSGSSWVALEIASVAPAPAYRPLGTDTSAPRLAIAGATLRNLDGWSASLFVSHAMPGPAAGEPVRLADATAVNARLARRLTRSTTLTLDAFNVLDRRESALDAFVASSRWSSGGMPEDFLVHPGEARGVRLGIRWTFR